jgi:hypothetical protein
VHENQDWRPHPYGFLREEDLVKLHHLAFLVMPFFGVDLLLGFLFIIINIFSFMTMHIRSIVTIGGRGNVTVIVLSTISIINIVMGIASMNIKIAINIFMIFSGRSTLCNSVILFFL